MSQSARGRFRLGPIPNYTATTSNGTRISCGGCCLPIPLGCLATVLAVAVPGMAALLRRRARSGRSHANHGI